MISLSTKGRINRKAYFFASIQLILIQVLFILGLVIGYGLYRFLENSAKPLGIIAGGTVILMCLYYSIKIFCKMICLLIQRWHDFGINAYWTLSTHLIVQLLYSVSLNLQESYKAMGEVPVYITLSCIGLGLCSLVVMLVTYFMPGNRGPNKFDS